MPVELLCVRELGGRLRARVVCFISNDGIRFDHAVDDSLRCDYPRHLLVEGRRYVIADEHIGLVGGNGALKYRASMTSAPEPDALRVFEVASECVACMAAPTSTVFHPCGHACACSGCAASMRRCCMCRAPVRLVGRKPA